MHDAWLKSSVLRGLRCSAARHSSSTSGSSSSPPQSGILLDRPSPCMAGVVLNRPQALNALNSEMCSTLRAQLLKWRRESEDGPHFFLMKGAGGKAFCAGGDVKTVWQELQQPDLDPRRVGTGDRGFVHSDFFRVEYEMNYLLGTSKIPQVSLWDGIVMGGGVGISALGAFRVATEKTLFAMPETAIGLFPDVGSSSWLPNLQPSGVGLYIGLCGVRLRASDLLQTGIATHYVSSDRLPALESTLASIQTTPETARSQIDVLLQRFHNESVSNLDSSKGLIPDNVQKIAATFASSSGQTKSIEDILLHLETNAHTCKWSQETLDLLQNMSPTSLQLTVKQLQEGRGKSLKECLQMEFRLMMRCMASPDFKEGIRAVLVDKDHSPKWVPSKFKVTALESQSLDSYFAVLSSENELDLLALDK